MKNSLLQQPEVKEQDHTPFNHGAYLTFNMELGLFFLFLFLCPHFEAGEWEGRFSLIYLLMLISG